MTRAVKGLMMMMNCTFNNNNNKNSQNFNKLRKQSLHEEDVRVCLTHFLTVGLINVITFVYWVIDHYTIMVQ